MTPWPFNTLLLKDITVGVRRTGQQEVLQWASGGKIRGILGAWVSTEVDSEANYKRLKRKLGPDKSIWPKRLRDWANEAAELTPEGFKAIDCQAGPVDQRYRRRGKVAVYELAQSGEVPGRYEEDDSPEERKWRFQMCLRLLLTCLIDIEENPGHDGWFSGRVLKPDSPEKGAPQPARPVEAKSPSTRRYRHGYGRQNKAHRPEEITSEHGDRPAPNYTDAAPLSRAPNYETRDSSPLFVQPDESDDAAEQATEHDSRHATSETTGDQEKEDQPAQVENQDISLYEATIDSLQRELATTKRKLEETPDTLKQERKKRQKSEKLRQQERQESENKINELLESVKKLEDAAGV